MKRKVGKITLANLSVMKHKPDHPCGEKGIALVLTLMILVFITAMVVEFSYGVYTATSALHNWKEAQKLSFASKSGVSLAVKVITSDIPRADLYKFPGKMAIPVEHIMEGFTGSVVVTVEDENAKFNMNSLKTPGNIPVFKRLLGNLGLDESIADRVAYWIDKNSVTTLMNPQEATKSAFMDSVDELLLIKGIDYQTYTAMLPFVTVYGFAGTEDARININTAPIPVIMSLNENISKEQAGAVVNERKLRPFSQVGQVSRAGLDSGLISGKATADPPQNFRITAVSEENGIKRVIETVVKISGSSQVLYWREM